MDAYNLHEAIFHVWRLIDFANKKMEEEKPWALLKEDRNRGAAILSNILELIRHVSVMLTPIIPVSTQAIRSQIGLPSEVDFETEKEWGGVVRWQGLGEAEILFPRIESQEAV
jgi:methionyl-tRNA synthetase